MLFLVGGPSQLDTWDMKPNAPVRDPRAVQADQDQRRRASRSARSSRAWRSTPTSSRWSGRCYHTGAAVHDTGHQMMQTGRLFQAGIETPHVGSRARLPEGPEGRRPAARAAAAADRQHRRQHAARPDRRLPRQGATTRSCSTPIPSDPNFKVPDLLPPDYLTAIRADRRRKLRDAGRRRGAGASRPAPTRGCSTPRSSRPTR